MFGTDGTGLVREDALRYAACMMRRAPWLGLFLLLGCGGGDGSAEATAATSEAPDSSDSSESAGVTTLGTEDGAGSSATTAMDGSASGHGDGDGGATTSDGDGDATTSDGDGDGDGDGTTSTGDGDGDGDGTTSDGDGTTSTGDGDGDGDGDGTTSDGDGDGDGDGDVDPPPPLDAPCDGYATRYWDCCKAHCGWEGNVNPATQPLQSCDAGDATLGADYGVVSACTTPAPGSAFTCFNMNPWAVSADVAYGFAAVPANGDICGRCYQLAFTGEGHYNPADPGSSQLAGKTMIVQATNIGFDVGGGQFDILIPGGGVGLFDACSYQWGVDSSELGATYGGLLTACQQDPANSTQGEIEACVLGRCQTLFADPAFSELLDGCEWFVGWYHAADNPNLQYQEVSCPQALIDISGIDRGPLDDVQACGGGGGGAPCTQEEMDACDCGWTNGGQNCGTDDGSCCWTACCG